MAFPILGADFLAAFDLLVDVRRCCLIRKKLPDIFLEAPACCSPYSKCGILPVVVTVDYSTLSGAVVDPLAAVTPSSTEAEVDFSSTSAAVPLTPFAGKSPSVGNAKSTCVLGVELERDFPAVFNAAKDLPPVIHRVEHHIETTGRPVAARYRRLYPAKLKAAKAEFAQMDRKALFAPLAATGPPHCIRSRKWMVPGGPVETSGSSTLRPSLTGTLVPTSEI